jgi:hypothetical protein
MSQSRDRQLRAKSGCEQSQQSALHILLTSILQIERPRIAQATKERQRVGRFV